jgi:hypothetical protein
MMLAGIALFPHKKGWIGFILISFSMVISSWKRMKERTDEAWGGEIT